MKELFYSVTTGVQQRCRMKIVTLLVFGLSLLNELDQTFQIQVPMIDESLPECDPRRDSLFCDFLDSETDIIRLDNRNETIEKIYIYNIATLHLSQPLCTNLALNSIGRVEIVETQPDACNKKIEIAAKDTLFSKIPENVKEIDLENCSLSFLTLTSFLTKVHILDSHIEVLNTSEPLANATSFKVLGSYIGRLENFVLEGSKFSMKSTQIDFISPRGLEVKRGTVKIENCSLKNVSDDSFIVYPKASLILRNISGNFMIFNERKASDGSLFNVENTEDKKIYYTEFVIVLSALVITLTSCIGLIFIHFIKKKNNSNSSNFFCPEEKVYLEKNGVSSLENEQKSLLDKSCNTDEHCNTEYLEKQDTSITVANRDTEYLEKQKQDTRTTQSSVISTSDCMATSDGTPNKIDDKLTAEPLSQPACHQSQDKLVDNVIVFHSDALDERLANFVAYALGKDKIRIVLKKSTYEWGDVERELLSTNPPLSDFPLIKLPINEFYILRNGQTFSRMSKSIFHAIEEYEQVCSFHDLENERNSTTAFKEAITTPTNNVGSRPSQPTENLGISAHPEITPSTNNEFLTKANKYQKETFSYDGVRPGLCKGRDISSLRKQGGKTIPDAYELGEDRQEKLYELPNKNEFRNANYDVSQGSRIHRYKSVYSNRKTVYPSSASWKKNYEKGDRNRSEIGENGFTNEKGYGQNGGNDMHEYEKSIDSDRQGAEEKCNPYKNDHEKKCNEYTEGNEEKGDNDEMDG